MNWLNILSGPIVGGVIGYFTNYIAVKMLFRPHHEIKLFGKTLPFTPGIIPKRRGALAKAVANAVSGSLLSRDDLASMLASESACAAVADGVISAAQDFLSDKTLSESLKSIAGDEKYESLLSALRETASARIGEKLTELQLGSNIATIAGQSVMEKVRGSMLAMFVTPDLIASFTGPMAERIDEYLLGDGVSQLDGMLTAEIDKLLSRPAAELISLDSEALRGKISAAYAAFVRDHAAQLTANFDVAAIVEGKMNAMDVMELENLVMSVMKNELNAIVNLGAVIGLIIGAINIFL